MHGYDELLQSVADMEQRRLRPEVYHVIRGEGELEGLRDFHIVILTFHTRRRVAGSQRDVVWGLLFRDRCLVRCTWGTPGITMSNDGRAMTSALVDALIQLPLEDAPREYPGYSAGEISTIEALMPALENAFSMWTDAYGEACDESSAAGQAAWAQSESLAEAAHMPWLGVWSTAADPVEFAPPRSNFVTHELRLRVRHDCTEEGGDTPEVRDAIASTLRALVSHAADRGGLSPDGPLWLDDWSVDISAVESAAPDAALDAFDDYDAAAASTDLGQEPAYYALGLGGEAGEVLDIVKKIIRDRRGVPTPEDREAIEKELGDVLWYLSRLARHYGTTLAAVATANRDKLASRKARGKLRGSGDDR